jgi:hypothetical protein
LNTLRELETTSTTLFIITFAFGRLGCSLILHTKTFPYSPQDAFKLKWFGFLLTAGGEGISDFFNLVFKVWLVLWWAVLYFYIKNTNHNKEQWEIFQQLWHRAACRKECSGGNLFRRRGDVFLRPYTL